MTTKEHMAEDIRRITYLVGLIRDGGDPDCYLTGRMLRIAFDSLSTACTYKGLFPPDWLEVLYPPAKPVAEEVSDGS